MSCFDERLIHLCVRVCDRARATATVDPAFPCNRHLREVLLACHSPSARVRGGGKAPGGRQQQLRDRQEERLEQLRGGDRRTNKGRGRWVHRRNIS